MASEAVSCIRSPAIGTRAWRRVRHLAWRRRRRSRHAAAPAAALDTGPLIAQSRAPRPPAGRRGPDGRPARRARTAPDANIPHARRGMLRRAATRAAPSVAPWPEHAAIRQRSIRRLRNPQRRTRLPPPARARRWIRRASASDATASGRPRGIFWSNSPGRPDADKETDHGNADRTMHDADPRRRAGPTEAPMRARAPLVAAIYVALVARRAADRALRPVDATTARWPRSATQMAQRRAAPPRRSSGVVPRRRPRLAARDVRAAQRCRTSDQTSTRSMPPAFAFAT